MGVFLENKDILRLEYISQGDWVGLSATLEYPFERMEENITGEISLSLEKNEIPYVLTVCTDNKNDLNDPLEEVFFNLCPDVYKIPYLHKKITPNQHTCENLFQQAQCQKKKMFSKRMLDCLPVKFFYRKYL